MQDYPEWLETRLSAGTELQPFKWLTHPDNLISSLALIDYFSEKFPPKVMVPRVVPFSVVI